MTLQEKKTRPLPFINVEIINKTLTNQIQRYIKIIQHNQVGFIPSMLNWFNIRKCKQLHQLSKEEKPYDPIG